MRYLIFTIALLLAATISFAQQKPKPATAISPNSGHSKTIRGVLVRGLDNYQPQVSPDGSVVAIKSVYSSPFPGAPFIVAIDIDRKSIREVPNLGEISVDNSYVYGLSGYFPETRPGKPAGTAHGFKMAGLFSDTTERVVFFSPLVYMVDAQSQRILGPGSIGPGNLMELSLYDLKNGEVIRPVCQASSSEIGKPELKLKNYILCQNNDRCVVVGLNSNDTSIRFECRGALRSYLADDSYVYLHPKGNGGTIKLNDVVAYDRRTGRKVATHSFPDAAQEQMMYAAYNNRLYRYDRAAATIYEEEPRDTGFAMISHCKTPGLSLPNNQKWAMVACNGPSVLFVPLNIEAAEAGGTAANTATLHNVADGKPAFRITPFYTRTATILAQQTAEQKASQEDMAKRNEQWAKEVAARKAAEPELKAAKCKAAWGNSQFNRGITRTWGVFEKAYVILESYDCDKDEYRIWQPDMDATVARLWGKYRTASGAEFRSSSHLGDKQYYTCSECDGDGSYEVTQYTTKTKELPWGYFSGIETKSIRTTATTRQQFCNRCHGRGVVLK